MRVLLTRLSALGDIVHTWPLATSLAAAPGVEAVAWVVEDRFLPLVAGHPSVHTSIPVATRRWRRHPFGLGTRTELAAARAALRAFRADVVLDPQGLVRSAAAGWASGASRRIGFVGALRRERPAGLFYTEVVDPPLEARHVIDLNLSLLSSLGVAPPYGTSPDGGFLVETADGPRPAPQTVALVPATGGLRKAWPTERYGELARRLARRGRPVTVVWGPGEEVLARSTADTAGSVVTVAPPTSIKEMAGFLAHCSVVIGGDTGPVHLAASLGVGTVAIHLTTDPERNGPRGRRVRIVSGAATGSRRDRARTGRAADVAVESVEAAVMELVGGGRPSLLS